MNTTMKMLIAGLLMVLTCAAQSPTVLTVGNAQQPPLVSVTQAGVAGSTTYYYWVVAIYAGGKSQPSGPLVITTANATLSSTNYDIVAFGAPTSPLAAVTGYDILRTTTQTPPSGTCNCAVATNQSSSPVNDQSNSLSGYTVATLGSVSVSVIGDNVSVASTTQADLFVNTTKVLTVPTAAGATFVNGIAPTSTTNLFTTFTTDPTPVAVNGTTDANNTIYVAPIFIPYTTTLNGACWYNGATVTTDKHMVELFNSAGTLIANSATAGAADSGNANKYQCVPFTSPGATVTVTGPALYWIGAVSNGTTDTLNTYAAGCCATNFFTATSAQTFGTPANITPPSSFNANQGPLMKVY